MAYLTIDPEKKMVALTFDDGPSNQNTNRILDVLEQNHARATFFVIGKRIADRTEVIARALSLGCEIGSHTWGHSDFTKYPKSALIDSLEKNRRGDGFKLQLPYDALPSSLCLHQQRC
jgi:peptidoglycan/xylan/chitin deacetylase (PgdA/CDA1 family)